LTDLSGSPSFSPEDSAADSNPDKMLSSPQHRAGEAVELYGMARLIRFTLLILYAALVLPLPFLAPPAWRLACWLALLLGALPILALLSERVELSDQGLKVGYPAWSHWLLRRGWFLPWSAITALTPVATSQGGRVFYVRVKHDPGRVAAGQKTAYLLPQRLEQFETFLASFSRYSGLNTAQVGRLTPAWTYQLLAIFSLLLLLGEIIGFAPMALGSAWFS
jgi:hypothetical protein